MARWEKYRRIFIPDGSLPWMRTRPARPVAVPLDDAALRILFAGLDEANRSRIGWNRQVPVSYCPPIGPAISEDSGRTYRRSSRGPLLDRDRFEPYFNPAPCVLREGDRWRMRYVSCTGWDEVDGHPEPMYQVNYTESDDGISCRRTDRVCVDYNTFTRAIGRLWVARVSDRYSMWYSYRGPSDYRTDSGTGCRIGYAESFDGLEWVRKTDAVGFERSAEGWDSAMVPYTDIFRVAGRLLCFCNGNGFGPSGLGYAVANDDGSMTKGAAA